MAAPHSATTVVAPDGTSLVLRTATSEDTAAVTEFYRRLPAEDRVSHLGVFDAYDRGFAQRATTAHERGGRALLAQMDAPERDQARAVVGEAHFELLADGDGELALVVAPEWRAWLGPRLLDAILDEAAASGVANLEVDVMRSDGWVRELVESHRHAVRPPQDWLTTRLVVGTHGQTPVWDAAPGPRVLVETPGGRWHAADAARAAGMTVMCCSTPCHHGSPCPMLEGTPCALVTGADVVVVSYPPDRQEWTELIATHREIHPDTPICIEGRARDEVPDGIEVLDVHDPDEVVRQVAALAAPRAAARARSAATEPD